MNDTIKINVPILARVEGDGALHLEIIHEQIAALQLNIYEPPRLFEKFLEGRSYTDVPDFVARICGICPVAYQMSSLHAIEDCFEVRPGDWVRTMRRLFYCGEWLESHSIHIHLLALPDFLHFKSAPDMAMKYPEEVKRGFRLQSFGVELIKLFGGRSVHPVGACAGGFFKAPTPDAINRLLLRAHELITDCEALIQWLATFNLPDNSHDFTTVSLYHPTEYPFNEGRIISNKGLNIAINEFDQHFEEFQVPHSTALHCKMKDESYLVGPLARVNHNMGHLPDEIHRLLATLNISFPSKNMYQSILARAVEIYYCVLEAVRILSQYQLPEEPHVAVQPRAGDGYGCTEAPRGLLWQHFRFNQYGVVQSARIVPPTSQNQARIEDDLRSSLTKFGLSKDEEAIRFTSEMIIRNYDPCISCATHFLTLTVNRT